VQKSLNSGGKGGLKKRRRVAGLRIFEVSARFWFALRRTEKRVLGGLAKVDPSISFFPSLHRHFSFARSPNNGLHHHKSPRIQGHWDTPRETAHALHQ
jgi:hypothetical protein